MKFFNSSVCLLLISSCTGKKARSSEQQCKDKVQIKHLECLTEGRHEREECYFFRGKGYDNCDEEYDGNETNLLPIGTPIHSEIFCLSKFSMGCLSSFASENSFVP